MKNLKIGITHGDTNGVGLEVILKTFSNDDMLSLCTPILYSSPKIAIYHRNALQIQCNFNVIASVEEAASGQLNMVNCFGEQELKIDFGQATPEAGEAAFVSLEAALKDLTAGRLDALVTAPINKASIQREGFHFPGHTEYIAQKVGDDGQPLMILMSESLRVALVTTHLPISQVASHITQEEIEGKLEILHTTLKRDFALDNPRIAVLSLNPHSGDNGLLGSEEQEIIEPAISNSFKRGIRCFGPYAADGFFGSHNYRHFDAILAMYHDQGLAPFKVLAMDNGVNYTAGLSVIRTSPAHGTAYDIASKNVADENSFRQAVYTAMDVARNRSIYDKAHRDPLRRQYFEKRDDSDKLKLDQVAD